MTNRVKVGIVGAGGISYTYLKNLTETIPYYRGGGNC